MKRSTVSKPVMNQQGFIICFLFTSVGLFLQRYFDYELHADNIPVIKDTLIKFDSQNDCTYKIPFMSTHYIHFTVDKYSDAKILFSFYQEYDQDNYMGRLTSCFTAVGKSCSLEVPEDGKYLVEVYLEM